MRCPLPLARNAHGTPNGGLYGHALVKLTTGQRAGCRHGAARSSLGGRLVVIGGQAYRLPYYTFDASFLKKSSRGSLSELSAVIATIAAITKMTTNISISVNPRDALIDISLSY